MGAARAQGRVPRPGLGDAIRVARPENREGVETGPSPAWGRERWAGEREATSASLSPQSWSQQPPCGAAALAWHLTARAAPWHAVRYAPP